MPEHAWKYCPKCGKDKRLPPLHDKCPSCGGPLREGYSPYARSKGAGKKKPGGSKR